MRKLSIAALWLTAWTANAAPITPATFATVRVSAHGVAETTPAGNASASLSRQYSSQENIGLSGAMNTAFSQWSGFARAGGSVFYSGANFTTETFTSTAFASIFDNFTVAQGSFIEIPVRVTGSIPAVSASASSNFPAGSSVSSSVSLGVSCNSTPFNGQSYGTVNTSCGAQSFIFDTSQTFDKTILLRFPVVPNVLHTFQTLWTINASMGFFVNGVVNGSISFIGEAEGDFTHTGVVYPARVLDANGNVIPNVEITSGSGFNYNNPFGGTTAVPEPSFAALVGGGLLAVVMGSRRRRS